MNVLLFDNPEFGQIRTLTIDNEPWFVGKDVATALGYKDTVNALKSHVDAEDKRGWQITTPSGEQEMTVINESGLYSLIFSSKLPKANEFKHWVTSEVLPAIRKTGEYAIPTRGRASVDTLNGIARIMRAADIPMKDQGSPPEARARQAQLLMDTYNIPHIPDYVKHNPWEPEQLTLDSPAPVIQIGRIENLTMLPVSDTKSLT